MFHIGFFFLVSFEDFFLQGHPTLASKSISLKILSNSVLGLFPFLPVLSSSFYMNIELDHFLLVENHIFSQKAFFFFKIIESLQSSEGQFMLQNVRYATST